MREWFSPAEIVAARSPELPGTERGFNMIVEREGWRQSGKARPVEGRGRSRWEYHISLLPAGAQARLTLLHNAPPPPAATQPAVEDGSNALWARFKGLSAKQKAECQRRLDCLAAFEAYVSAGSGETAAVAMAASETGASSATVFNWRKMVRGVARADWLPALAASYVSTATHAECHPRFWEAVTSDWLRPEAPRLTSCYRRARQAASKQGWLPIPSERAIRRRIQAEIPAGVITLAREGRDKAKTLYPAQKRIRTHFHAMEAVNMDGHKLDLFVAIEKRITRVMLLGIQDLLSGTVLSWRLSETENKETVRLVIGDMVERYGIPEKMWLDNGKAFSSKWISGRMKHRHQFKIRDEDPKGILISLGVDLRWTKPYSGQSKPIERAWRDLADEICKHPFCAGAYTGNTPNAKPENYGNAAIPIETLREHVARVIADHNSRTGRKAAACAGRSFLETFEASLSDPATIVRRATAAQRHLWLLAAEKVRAQKGSGEIHFLENRYWSSALNAHAGQQLVIRFDPERLQEDIKVYTLDDRFICDAPCIAATGFDDVDAAREHARDRAAFLKTQKEQLRLTRKMSAAELARLYGAEEKAPPPKPMRPAVTRLAVATAMTMPAVQSAPDSDFEASVAAGLRLLQEQRATEADIIPFQPRRAEDG